MVPDIHEWTQLLARKLVAWAAPKWAETESEAEGLAEDWQALLDDRPGSIAKFATALGFCVSAARRYTATYCRREVVEVIRRAPSLHAGLIQVLKRRSDRHQREAIAEILGLILTIQRPFRQRVTDKACTIIFIGPVLVMSVAFLFAGVGLVGYIACVLGVLLCAWITARVIYQRRRKKFALTSDPEATYITVDPRTGRRFMVTYRAMPDETNANPIQ